MLKVQNISFSYVESETITNLDFAVNVGDIVALIGESGSGKSTLLKLIYGLYDLEIGNITWNNEVILGPKFNLIPGHSKIKYLAQDYDLMLYTTVAENVGKFLSNVNVIKKKERIRELLQLVEMTEYASTKVQFLSGGQQQRVALAKVLALEPELLLLDEPFSQIDTFRKNNLIRNLFAYFKQKQITCIVASHHSTDTLSFSESIIIMKNGMIVQNEISKKVYENPKNKYVASLFGEVNEIRVKQLIPSSNSEKRILLYSHEMKIVEESKLKVAVQKCFFRGINYLIESTIDNETIFFENSFAMKKNEKVFLSANLDTIQNRL